MKPLERALLSLEGLAVGDAFGRSLGKPPEPGRLWPWTDDTAMALGVVEVLKRRGRIDQDDLARTFASRYAAEPDRGYGPRTVDCLQRIGAGEHWGTANRKKRPWLDRVLGRTDAEGSLGNGAAMRAAPLGAYFAHDVLYLVREAAASAEVTHAHPEGVEGALAVALAAGLLATGCKGPELLPRVIENNALSGKVLHGIRGANTHLLMGTPFPEVVRDLGNGVPITAERTVPLALYLASTHAQDYRAALMAVLEAGGDVDTLGAIVGGLVVLSAGRESIPPEWRHWTEPLPAEFRSEVPAP